MTEAEIEGVASAVLRAAGSRLGHYTPANRKGIVDAARAAIAALDKARGDGARVVEKDAPTQALLIAGKHVAVKLAEVYRAVGQAPGACQALRDFNAAVRLIESRGGNASPLPAPPTTEGE